MVLNWPFVSIIIVNYNGQRYLDDCLMALHEQTYPLDCFEVVIIDNGSSDNSVEWVQQNYSWVRIIQSTKNLGFAGGNNLGVRQTHSDYVAFLNNDTRVDRDWLKTAVTVCEQDPFIGGVTSKLLLYEDYLSLELRVRPEVEPVWIYNIQTSDGKAAEELEGFSAKRRDDDRGGTYRYVKDWARFRVPVSALDKDLVFEVEAATAALQPTGQVPSYLEIYMGGETIACWLLAPVKEKFEGIVLAPLLTMAVSLIQNAGTVVFFNGMGRDRGTYTLTRGAEHTHHYEEDCGQYNQIEEIFAGCGASFICRRSMLEDVGGFDESFFMYYEDVDLSWRARLRGWKILYAPNSIVRHIHRGSSSKWEDHKFRCQIERNRLALLGKNASFKRWFSLWLHYLWRTIWLAGWLSKDTFLLKRPGLDDWWAVWWVRINALFGLLGWLPRLMIQRWQIWRRRRVSAAVVESWLVEVIT